MIHDPLWLSPSTKWPGRAQSQVRCPGGQECITQQRRDPGRGGNPQNQATSVPRSCPLHCRAPGSRNSGRLLPCLAFLQEGTRTAPCPDPKADISSYLPDPRAAGPARSTLRSPSAVPPLPGSWAAAPLSDRGLTDRGFGV